MEIHFKIIGVLFITLALVHAVFPRYFKWEEELSSLSLINRQMMIVHTFFIALVVLLMGLQCFLYPAELTTTNLGKKISLGLGIFWACRLFIQLFGYSAQLWRGKTFETAIHIIFTFTWAYCTLVFLKAAFY